MSNRHVEARQYAINYMHSQFLSTTSVCVDSELLLLVVFRRDGEQSPIKAFDTQAAPSQPGNAVGKLLSLLHFTPRFFRASYADPTLVLAFSMHG